MIYIIFVFLTRQIRNYCKKLKHFLETYVSITNQTKMPMTTRSMTAAARRFHAWATKYAPKKPLYDDEEEWEAQTVERQLAAWNYPKKKDEEEE